MTPAELLADPFTLTHGDDGCSRVALPDGTPIGVVWRHQRTGWVAATPDGGQGGFGSGRLAALWLVRMERARRCMAALVAFPLPDELLTDFGTVRVAP